MERGTSTSKTRHLSVVGTNGKATEKRLTRAQVADRLGASVSTVRRYEGVKLHPKADDAGVHWFDPAEVTALGAERANEQRPGRRNAGSHAAAKEASSSGETAALVFERFEQRQSLAEIVIALRSEPEAVRALFDQWTIGLTEGQLRLAGEPTVMRDSDIARATPETLASRLAALPAEQLARISVGRYRGPFQHGDREYADVVELGGFMVSGPCDVGEITARFGPGDYRISAYRLEPAGMLWEVVVEELGASMGDKRRHRP